MNKKILYVIIGISLLYILLLIPGSNDVNIETEGNATPFVWNQDKRWDQLEDKFTQAKTYSRSVIADSVEERVHRVSELLDELEKEKFQPNDHRLNKLLENFFELSPFVAAMERPRKDFMELYSRGRRIIKERSVNWDIHKPETRIILYKTLYGMRAATEEALLQAKGPIDPVLRVQQEPSATPSTTILGIEVHSGDLLVSRGGAEVSALISRGNDFPGNFSHVALIYVDENTKEPFLIEAHIERGVAIASADEYIKDRKLRFMVLRPRADLPKIKEEPMLPHLAAKKMLEEAQNRHIPYDFKMDFYDPKAMFCSEVGSYAYRQYGIELWKSESTISSIGVVNLLNTFGVENFVTQMPSDLEYDPQLSIVGEWRDTRALFEDHVYNAVIDAMLVCSEQGKEIEYDLWMLPVVRVVKAYSYMMNMIGKTGPVPEGMSAMQAIKSDAFIQRHEVLKEKLRAEVRAFSDTQGYTPPYWELVRMAEENTGCDTTS